MYGNGLSFMCLIHLSLTAYSYETHNVKPDIYDKYDNMHVTTVKLHIGVFFSLILVQCLLLSRQHDEATDTMTLHMNNYRHGLCSRQ